MPTQFLDVQAAGNGGSVATELLFPVYLSLDAEGVGVSGRGRCCASWTAPAAAT
jgi:hypothetical protein